MIWRIIGLYRNMCNKIDGHHPSKESDIEINEPNRSVAIEVAFVDFIKSRRATYFILNPLGTKGSYYMGFVPRKGYFLIRARTVSDIKAHIAKEWKLDNRTQRQMWTKRITTKQVKPTQPKI